MSNLTKIRGKHGMTQTELGNLVGMTRAGMSYLEKTPLTVKNAKKFAELLNENIFDILGEDVLKIQPETDEDKEKVINIILGIRKKETATTEFGEKIRNLRKAKNLTLQELSMISNVSALTIWNLEHGKNTPTAVSISKLAKALDADYEELINLIEQRKE